MSTSNGQEELNQPPHRSQQASNYQPPSWQHDDTLHPLLRDNLDSSYREFPEATEGFMAAVNAAYPTIDDAYAAGTALRAELNAGVRNPSLRYHSLESANRAEFEAGNRSTSTAAAPSVGLNESVDSPETADATSRTAAMLRYRSITSTPGVTYNEISSAAEGFRAHVNEDPDPDAAPLDTVDDRVAAVLARAAVATTQEEADAVLAELEELVPGVVELVMGARAALVQAVADGVGHEEATLAGLRVTQGLEGPMAGGTGESVREVAVREPNVWVTLVLGLFVAVAGYVMVRGSKVQGRKEWLADAARGGPAVFVFNLVMAYTLEKTGVVLPIAAFLHGLEIPLRYLAAILWAFAWALTKSILSLLLVQILKDVFIWVLAVACKYAGHVPTKRQLYGIGTSVTGVLGIALILRTMGSAAWYILAAQVSQVVYRKPWAVVMASSAGIGAAVWTGALHGLAQWDMYTYIFKPETWAVLESDPPQPAMSLFAAGVVMVLHLRGVSVWMLVNFVYGFTKGFVQKLLEVYFARSQASDVE